MSVSCEAVEIIYSSILLYFITEQRSCPTLTSLWKRALKILFQNIPLITNLCRQVICNGVFAQPTAGSSRRLFLGMSVAKVDIRAQCSKGKPGGHEHAKI